jgi:hypothetical protein
VRYLECKGESNAKEGVEYGGGTPMMIVLARSLEGRDLFWVRGPWLGLPKN